MATTNTATRSAVISALVDNADATRAILADAGINPEKGMDTLARMLNSINRPVAKTESAASKRNARAVHEFAEKIGTSVVFDGHEIAAMFPMLLTAPARTAVLTKGVSMGKFVAHRLACKTDGRGKGSVVYQVAAETLAPWGDEPTDEPTA